MRGAPKQASNQVVAPGGALISPTGQVLYQAPYKPEPGADQDGGYNRKGDWITPNGIFIGKSEVAKDREIVRSANELRQGISNISPSDVKKTDTILGDVTQGGVKGYLAKQFGSEAVAAQAKINASSVMQTLQNLPPGPASDKDIAQAKSSFPGYGNAKALEEWMTNTNAMLERKINNANQKYGSESWYGANGISSKPSVKNGRNNGVPNGVPPEVWAVMTPEEKDAFQ